MMAFDQSISDDSIYSLDDIVTNDQLSQRPCRPPQFEEENRALVALSRALAESPGTMLQKLVDTALKLCDAGSAGISVLENTEGEDHFRWRATAGAFAPLCGGTLPRGFSPCGTVLDRNAVQLMQQPARFFPYIAGMAPPVVELLLIPFYQDDKAVGTVWVVSHTPDKRFEAEDARLVTSLCNFASAAVKILVNLEALHTANTLLLTEADNRVKAERDKSEIEAFHRFASEAGRTGSWYVQLDTMECIFSPMMAALMDFPVGQTSASALQWRNSVVPEDRLAMDSAINACIQTDAPLDVEFRIATKNGAERWLYSRGGVVRDPGGKPLRLHGASVDITERKRSAASSSEREAYLRAVLNSSAGGFYGVDCQGYTTVCNAAFLKMLGFESEQDIIGKKLHDVIHHSYRDGSHYPTEKCHIYLAASTGQAAHVEGEDFFRVDGTSFPVEYWSYPIIYDGIVRGAVTTFVDVTERLRTEEALREARDAAEAANRAKDRFMAVLSHELRTPLSPVVMTIPAIELDPELPEKFREDLAMVRRNIDLEIKLIDDLLDLSRVTNGKLRLHMQPVAGHEVIRYAIESSISDASGKRVEVRSELTAENDALHADPARLQQVLWNLIRNAMKFTPEGGLITLRTWNQADPHQLHIEVSDTGVGIEAEMLTRIFDAFEQGEANTTREFGGLGLGLAIAKAVVELHGGTITAASDGLGKGGSLFHRARYRCEGFQQHRRIFRPPTSGDPAPRERGCFWWKTIRIRPVCWQDCFRARDSKSKHQQASQPPCRWQRMNHLISSSATSGCPMPAVMN